MEDFIQRLKRRTFVIAEIGCNHNGDMEIARRLIQAASEAGADSAKFQSFNPGEMITENSPKAAYQIRATGTGESQFQRLSRLTLSPEQHLELKAFCQELGIVFCSSPFDFNSVKLLAGLDVPFFKIPSGEITNLPLLKLIGSFGKPAILSTVLSTLGEIETALEAIGEENRGQIILMHCTSDYPARWDEANLRAIQTLREAFHLPVGFSDHTEGIELPLVAVGLGAVVIEKHITLSKAMDGGDHKASLEPGEFKDMVVKIRSLEKALGDGIKRCMPSEENVRDVARKSLVTARPLKKGDQLTPEDIAIKRPGTGISPLFLEKIRGARLMADLPEGRVLQWSQLQLADKEYN